MTPTRASRSVYFTGSRHGFHRIISRTVTAMTTTAYTNRILIYGKNTVLAGRPAMRQSTTQMMPACGLAAVRWITPHGLILMERRFRQPKYTVWSEPAPRPREGFQAWTAIPSSSLVLEKKLTGVQSP